MNRRITVILTALILALILASCGSNGQEGSGDPAWAKANGNKTLHTLYFKDITQREDVRAVFYNSNTKETADVKMTASGEDSDGFVYTCEGDASAYNMVSFSYDGISTIDVAFNNCVSGWYNSRHGFLPFTFGVDDPYERRIKNKAVLEETFIYDNEIYDDVTLTFNGYDKVIHVWTPDDYDPSSDEKYATVYLLDGQVMIFLGLPGETLLDSEHADVQVQSMTAQTGYNAIVVAIDTGGDASGLFTRLDEMTPDLGELAYEEETKKQGNLFSDFVVESVVPYIQQHYNVYTDALHTSIVGRSLGGLESFYIALEHPDLFGTAGALSPAFMLYNDNMWRAYLGKKNFDERSPFLYFYSGKIEEEDNENTTDKMVDRIKEMGYPENRLVYHRDKIGGHAVPMWRSCFSEFLEAMVFRSVKPLQQP